MRGLKTTDIFSALRIISAAGIAEEVKLIAKKIEAIEKTGESLNPTDIGVGMILGVLEKIVQSPAEKAFYRFISGPLELSEKDISNMDPLDLFDKLADLKDVIDVERWKIFFVRLAQFIQNAN